MRSAISTRRLLAEDWPAYRDLRLRALADAPNAFGSLLTYEQPRADSDWRERVATAVAAPEQCPVFAVREAVPIGLVWARLDSDDPALAHVFQMWVAPEHRGAGAGMHLLDAVIDWAHAAQVGALELRVATGDSPATRLYMRAGFRVTGELEPLRQGSAIQTQRMRLDLRSAD